MSLRGIFLPKQSPLMQVKLLNLEIASLHRTLLATTFSDFEKAMSNNVFQHLTKQRFEIKYTPHSKQ